MKTELELQQLIKAFCTEVGPKARVSTSLNDSSAWTKPVYFALYRDGIGRDVTFSFEAETFEAAIEQAREKWAEQKTDHEKRMVRQMALAIIRITADQGECTDAALRQEFEALDLARFSKEAIDDANAIASNGPFSIAYMHGANAA